MERSFFPINPTGLDTSLSIIVAIFLACIVALLVALAIKKHKESRISKHFRLNHSWRKTGQFIILICAFLTTALTVSAEEILVVKQNKTVYFFQIGNYRDANMFIIADVLVNPTVADLVILEAPKASWDIINRVEDGIYFSYKDKQDAQIKALREENAKLRQAKEKSENESDQMIFCLFIALIMVIILAFVVFKNLKNKSKSKPILKNKI